MSAAATMRPRSLRTRVAASRREVGPGQAREAADRDERRLEVVGHRVVEALELGVLGREVGALGAQRLLVRAQVARHAVERAREVAELVGRVERQRVVEVARGDLAGGAAHLGERAGERAREEQAREQRRARASRRSTSPPSESSEVRWPLHSSAVRFSSSGPQRGLPGGLRERRRRPSPPSRRPRRPEAELGLVRPAAADHGPPRRCGSAPTTRFAVARVRGRAVGEDAGRRGPRRRRTRPAASSASAGSSRSGARRRAGRAG